MMKPETPTPMYTVSVTSRGNPLEKTPPHPKSKRVAPSQTGAPPALVWRPMIRGKKLKPPETDSAPAPQTDSA